MVIFVRTKSFFEQFGAKIATFWWLLREISYEKIINNWHNRNASKPTQFLKFRYDDLILFQLEVNWSFLFFIYGDHFKTFILLTIKVDNFSRTFESCEWIKLFSFISNWSRQKLNEDWTAHEKICSWEEKKVNTIKAAKLFNETR